MDISIEIVPNIISTSLDVAWYGNWVVYQALDPCDVFIPCFGNVLDSIERIELFGYVYSQFAPVQHIAVRSIHNNQELIEIFESLKKSKISKVLLVGGNAKRHKMFASTMEFLEKFDMTPYGITHVYFAGHPDGHPHMENHIDVLRDKVKLASKSYKVGVVSQFSFNADAILKWVKQVETFLPQQQIKVGVMGPMNAPKLLQMCKICGVKLPILFLIKQLPKFILGRYLVAGILRKILKQYPNVGVHVFGVNRAESAVTWLKSEMNK